MFVNKTAWFSQSCDSKAKSLWVENGGSLTNVGMAHFVFSDDWESSDTVNLYNCDAYLKQHLAVFRAQYVFDAVQERDKVVLGTYFLVPPHIKEMIATRRNDKNTLRSPNLRESDQSSNGMEIQNNKQTAVNNLSSPHHSNGSREEASKKQPAVTATSCLQQKHTAGKSMTIDLESIPHVQNLPKVIGCLGTIRPGQQGVEVKYKELVKKKIDSKCT